MITITALFGRFLDEQYNARASIPDAPAILKRWASQSASVRLNQQCLLNLSFATKPIDDPAQTLDYFPADCPHNTSQPKRRSARPPLLIFIHGGYWRSLDKSDFSFIAPAYNARGIDVAIVNYALAPGTALPTICLQIVRAIAWLYSQRDNLGFDAKNITVAGHSAGGHLAAMAFAARWDALADPITNKKLPAHLIKKALTLSGIFDLEPIRLTPFLSEAIVLTKAQATSISPACFKQPRQGTIWTMVGDLESTEFHRQSRLLHEAWPARASAAQSMANCNHLTICDQLADVQSVVGKALLDLLQRPLTDLIKGMPR